MSTTRRQLGTGPAPTSTAPAAPPSGRLLPAERTTDQLGQDAGHQDVVLPAGRRILGPGAAGGPVILQPPIVPG
ncbi:hypothetical protein [Streptomyces sp. NPDC101455]|uniref:hypothetical protein n=1 Tax=Streptomyces sp. NPDC101455 TaxID=3366142 RepID=UPI00380C7324